MGLHKTNAGLIEIIDNQNKRIAELEAVLRPFADTADVIDILARNAVTDVENIEAKTGYKDYARARDILKTYQRP